MGRWLITVATAVLVSCGSSSSPTYDGGINGTPPTGNTGFVFTPADGAALTVGPTTCTIQGVGSASVSALMVGFSSYSGVCGFVRDHGIQCMEVGKASATLVSVAIFRAALASAAPIGPGTYTLNAQGGGSGTQFEGVGGTVTITNPTCGDSGPASVDGTITIASASAAQVAGSVDLTWTGGGFSGPFDVAGCTANVDLAGPSTRS